MKGEEKAERSWLAVDCTTISKQWVENWWSTTSKLADDWLLFCLDWVSSGTGRRSSGSSCCCCCCHQIFFSSFWFSPSSCCPQWLVCELHVTRSNICSKLMLLPLVLLLPPPLLNWIPVTWNSIPGIWKEDMEFGCLSAKISFMYSSGGGSLVRGSRLVVYKNAALREGGGGGEAKKSGKTGKYLYYNWAGHLQVASKKWQK